MSLSPFYLNFKVHFYVFIFPVLEVQRVLCPAGGAVLPGQDVTPHGSSGGGGVEDGVRVTAEPPQH